MPLKDAGRERERQADKSRRQSLALAAVTIPKCKRPDLLEDCRRDLHLFLREAFPYSTGLKPFGAGQVQAIKHIEHAILHGGRVAQAFPRGFAKTAISARAAIWGVLYSHRKYIPVFTASEENSQNIIDGIKTELAENDVLLEMFPALECVRALEGKAQRCHSQHIDGVLTHMRWRADKIVLPTVPGFDASGGVLQAKAMRSARGLQHTGPSGEIIRPDFVILDDVQTDEDARSQATVAKIVEKIKKSILRGGGHSKSLAAVMNCTVIEPDDVAEFFLEAPGWQSVRYKMVTSMPENMKLWEGPYREILTSYDKTDPMSQLMAKKKAMEFYVENRAEMDRGAECSWEWAYAWGDDEQTEVSAIQHAMNIKLLEGDEVFFPECQNEPQRLTDGLQLTPEMIMAKRTSVFGVPQESQHLVCHVDVQSNMLIYTVAGIGADYTGGIVQIGAYPEQPKEYYRNDNTDYDFERLFPGESVESQIYKALDQLVGLLVKKSWQREDGVDMHIDKILIDSGYKGSTVELFCRSGGYGSLVMPARGVYIGARNASMSEKKWEPKQGEARGNEWEIRKTADGSSLQVTFDANYWKSFVWDRWTLGIGTPSAWRITSLPQKRVRMFADQVTSEFPTKTEGRGRELLEWQLLPGRKDNHYFDNCVGIAVAANIVGCRLPNADRDAHAPRKVRRRVSFSDIKGRR